MGGLLIGVLVKRPILAMALYFPFFAFTVFLFFLPMHIVPPLQSQWDFKGANPDSQTQYIYEVSKSFIDQDGKEINQTEVLSSCVKKEGTIYVNPDFSSCFIEKGLILVTRFQPASRFWVFQAIDIGICIILSILFYFLSVFWIKEKIS
ncbi:MAG: hypothetical protein VB108_06405 [Anaerolineaceae bacterium]|nr:hypothetical protein [Anaerolineaceae bacterium]